jgi:hypothetical protein
MKERLGKEKEREREKGTPPPSNVKNKKIYLLI